MDTCGYDGVIKAWPFRRPGGRALPSAERSSRCEIPSILRDLLWIPSSHCFGFRSTSCPYGRTRSGEGKSRETSEMPYRVRRKAAIGGRVYSPRMECNWVIPGISQIFYLMRCVVC